MAGITVYSLQGAAACQRSEVKRLRNLQLLKLLLFCADSSFREKVFSFNFSIFKKFPATYCLPNCSPTEPPEPCIPYLSHFLQRALLDTFCLSPPTEPLPPCISLLITHPRLFMRPRNSRWQLMLEAGIK